MRWGSTAALLLLLASACGTVSGDEYAAPLPPDTNDNRQIPEGLIPVIRVIDGDTVAADVGGVEEHIRFKGVNTRELHPDPPGSPPEPFAEAARDYVFATIGTHIRLVFDSDCSSDPLVLCRDNPTYNRLLAYIELTDGSDLGARELQLGLAEVYVYQGEHFDRRSQYEALQAQAQADHVGMWQ